LDDLGLVRHVEGEVSEPDEDVYQMDVASTRDASVACTLVNTPPILHGPRNTVTITCSAPPTAAHVHEGNAGVNGPIVITLTPPATGDPGASSECLTVDTTLLADILQHPSQYYVNVHNATFPGGAIRDQLVRHPH
jgi:hypothetical protein